MADEGLKSDLRKLLAIEERAVDATRDLTVADVGPAFIADVRAELERIKELARDFRNGVRTLKERYKDALTPTDLTSLEDRAERLIADVKNHYNIIQTRVHEIDPVKPMTEFEKESLAQQKKNTELQQQTLKEQQLALQDGPKNKIQVINIIPFGLRYF